jgi:hypothetical protein
VAFQSFDGAHRNLKLRTGNIVEQFLVRFFAPFALFFALDGSAIEVIGVSLRLPKLN